MIIKVEFSTKTKAFRSGKLGFNTDEFYSVMEQAIERLSYNLGSTSKKPLLDSDGAEIGFVSITLTTDD